MTTVKDYLAELKRLDEAATDGPWEFCEDEQSLRSDKFNHTASGAAGYYESSNLLKSTAFGSSEGEFVHDEDGRLAAAARNALPVLLKMVADARKAGVIEGMTRFAWWKDGVEQVGTCGTTLKQAIANFETEASE